MGDLKIGELAARTGTSAPTIRYYEEIGLLPKAGSRVGGQRRYVDNDVKRLTFIRRCRDFGFPIDQVRALNAMVHDPQSSCMAARDLAHAHLLTIQTKLVELKALEGSIASFVKRCDTACAGGPGPDCVILEDLANPWPENRSPAKPSTASPSTEPCPRCRPPSRVR
jgi:DNA-binding transcriptional MerR regulator